MAQKSVLLKAFFDIESHGVFMTNSEGGFCQVNNEFCKLTQYTEEELSRKRVDDVIIRHSSEREYTSKEQRAQLRLKSGSLLPVLLEYSSNLDNKDGFLTGHVHDISSLEEGEDVKYKSLFESMPMGVVFHNADGTVATANPEALRILGLSLDQLTGMTSMDSRWRAIHEDGSPYSGDEHPAMISLKESISVKDQIMGVFNPLEDRYYWLSISSNPLFKSGESRPYSSYAVFDDITEKKKEQSLQDEVVSLSHDLANLSKKEIMERALSTGVENTDSHSGFFHWVDHIKERIKTECWSERSSELFPEETGQKFIPFDNSFISSECFSKQESVIRNHRNSLIFKRDICIPLMDKGHIRAVFGVVNKTTLYSPEEIRSIQAFVYNIWTLILRKEMEQELKEASVAKSRFLSVMSHEIRTPMNAIVGMAEALMETALTDEQKQYVELFSHAGESLMGIINNVLDISKIESGKLSLESIPFNLMDVVQQCGHILSFRAVQKDLELIFYTSPDLKEQYIGDPIRIKQIIMNLVGNAVKYTEEGHILVFIEALDKESREVSGIKITVEDTGIGIPKERQKDIFKSYVQGDNSISRRYGGTGLGLNIVEHLVSLMNGTIKVESEPGKGSIISCTILLEANPDKIRDGINSPRDSFSILVGKMHPLHHRIIKESLEIWCCQKVSFFSGDIPENTNKADLVILDEKYSVIPERCNVPIMMLSYNPMSRVARDDSSISYFPRPLFREDLRVHVFNFLLSRQSDNERVLKKPIKGLGKFNILLADDSEMNLQVLTSQLKGLPFNIKTVMNGKEACDEFFTGKYHLVLLDLQMPVMDGYNSVREMRKWESTQDTTPKPILAVSAYAFKEDVKKSLESGFDLHISKPVKRQTLLKSLSKYLPIEEFIKG